jgi:hypothetical protein
MKITIIQLTKEKEIIFKSKKKNLKSKTTII